MTDLIGTATARQGGGFTTTVTIPVGAHKGNVRATGQTSTLLAIKPFKIT